MYYIFLTLICIFLHLSISFLILDFFLLQWYYFYGILRSGQEIIHTGSIIVLGDVNPGAVVRAGENIIIMGNLKGRAFSGLDRKKNKSFIIAQGMNPEQIGIGAYGANSPKEKNTLSTTPETAYASENRIYVEEIDFKSLQNMVE